ncbi:MAG TPA: Fe-S-containing hydro-lyase [Fastidiosipila sp.]|nr:Fe-S-containing hydro-lyase [Fastidiosipila sp.]
MSAKQIKTPLTPDIRRELKAGERVLLSGTIYAARDAAHMRFMESLSKGEALPFPIKDSIIYYVGPTPTRPGHVIGSAGPTTASRMDRFMPELLDLGLGATIGKGFRSQAVIDRMVDKEAVYFGAIGGLGALIAACIKEQEVIAYDELGAESCRRFEVEHMPLIVLVDSRGNNWYEDGPDEWKRRQKR